MERVGNGSELRHAESGTGNGGESGGWAWEGADAVTWDWDEDTDGWEAEAVGEGVAVEGVERVTVLEQVCGWVKTVYRSGVAYRYTVRLRDDLYHRAVADWWEQQRVMTPVDLREPSWGITFRGNTRILPKGPA